MPRASKRRISNNLKTELTTNFSDLIATLQSPSEINEFLNTFLTQEEKIMVSKRLMLYIMLGKKYKNADIADFLSVSRVTVVHHKNKWYLRNNSFKLMLNKLLARRKAKKFWDSVDVLLSPLDAMMDTKTNMKARAKLYSWDFKSKK